MNSLPTSASVYSPPSFEPPVTACLNCDARLTGAYCAACGQPAVDLTASTSEIVKEALQDAIDLDGRAIRTTRALLSPGRLTTEFLRGRRVPYLSPLKLFLLAGTVLTTTWIVTRGVDARYYGMSADQSAATYINTVVRGSLAAAFAIALASWGFSLARRRFIDEMIFAMHLVAAIALWAAVVIWLGTGWKVLWRTADAVPRALPALPYIMFAPAALAALAYVIAAIHRVHRGRWWWTLLRAAVVVALGIAAVITALSVR